MHADIQQVKERVGQQSDLINRVQNEIGKAVIGQQHMVSRLLVGMLTEGHVLLEGVPGLAKTTVVNALASALSVDFQRIQFTPDLLPADLIGTLIYQPGEGTFATRKGPIFSNLILADEINRAPSKVQSALLEAMQERQVTIGEETFPLERPFLVLATQNPLEQEGTYPLPEAQVDRFMLKVDITYPKPDEERRVLDMALEENARPVESVLQVEQIFEMQNVVKMIYIDDQIRDYIISLVNATRDPSLCQANHLAPLIEYGASPRAGIFLGKAARAIAFLNGRAYVTPQDVKDVAHDILRHRIGLTFEAEAEEKTADNVVAEILKAVPVP